MREEEIKIDVRIRPLALSDAEACDAIIRSLPEFFGRAGGIAACAADVRSQRGLVAEHSGAIQAFLTWTSEYPASAEITWMAVRSGWRGQ
ncbi:MAG: hypothetical protein M3Z66_05540, partial [Chloroflexota bacterium]|nr:hypothetical protein [Chloroflexota bacterium]